MAGLEEICTFAIDLASEMRALGATPLGQRFLLDIVGGEVSGDRLQGAVVSGGGDWMLLGPDGWGRLDVRFAFVTDDGASITFTGNGLLHLNETVMTAIGNGAPTEFADQYYRVLARLEAGDERYVWVNQAVFVSEGRIAPRATGRGIEARLLRVT